MSKLLVTSKTPTERTSPWLLYHKENCLGGKMLKNWGDLERLVLVLETMPDEALVKAMERARFRGRNDYPIRAVWNSILAGLVYQHPTIASLRRELQRNAQLRQLCGFDLWKGLAAVPPDYVYSRFIKKLMNEYSHFVDEMFNELVEILTELLPDSATLWRLTVKPSKVMLIERVTRTVTDAVMSMEIGQRKFTKVSARIAPLGKK